MKNITNLIKKNIKTTIWKYYIFTFLRDLSFFSAVLVPFFTEWGNISLTQVQFLQSWFMFWIFILEIPTGAVADYIGRKFSISIGAFLLVITAIIYGSTPSFGIFLLAEFLFAVSVALTSGADEALLYDTLKEAGREDESKKIFGKSNSFHLLGMLVAAPIGSYMASKWGLNSPMLLFSIPCFFAGIVAWSMKEPKIKEVKSESTRYIDIIKNGFRFLKDHKILKLLALDAIIVASSSYFIIWLYQPLLRSIGIGIIYLGIVHAILVLSEILISNNFEKLTKLFGSDKRYLRASAIIVIVTFILVAIWPNIITISILIIFGGGFGLTRLSLMSTYMNKFIPSNQRATILSSISMFRRFALVILNPIIGFTADHSLRIAALVVGLLPLVIFLFSPIEQEMLEDT